MSKFRAGDRVRRIKNMSGYADTGTIVENPYEDEWELYVQLDSGGPLWGFFEYELELIESVEDVVNHPTHYKSESGMEVIDVIEAFDLDRYLANVVKYVLRSPSKGNEVEDLKKAIWYLQRKVDRFENS